MCGRLITVGTHLILKKKPIKDYGVIICSKSTEVLCSIFLSRMILTDVYLCSLTLLTVDWQRLITMMVLMYWGMEIMYWSSCLLNYKGKQQPPARSYFHESLQHLYFHWGNTHTLHTCFGQLETHALYTFSLCVIFQLFILMGVTGNIKFYFNYSLRMRIFFLFDCVILGTEQLCSLNSPLQFLERSPFEGLHYAKEQM